MFEALDIQDELQTLYTSGTVFHTFLGEKLPSWKAAATLVRKIAENYKLPYYTMSPTYSICKNHGYIRGEQYTCPCCGEETEVYSRITGYYRPVKNWNDGKAQEFKERKVYTLSDAVRSVVHKDKEDALNYEYHISDSRRKIQAKPVKKGESQIREMAEDGMKAILFTTKTCPNCRIATKSLEKAHISYELVDAEENEELVKKYGVMQAPTLVVVDGDKVEKMANASNIKAYAENNKE